MMNDLVAIGLGGAAGAIARYGVAHACNLLFGTNFPYGTLVVNILGSFLIGILFVMLVERGLLPAVWRSVLIVGFLGAFTTFSTFSLQTVALFEEGRAAAALLYVGSSVLVCVLAAALGLLLARQLPG